ncbi:hypothetical protein BRADI_2g60533v3 [Brachypodium distachyon]|uniref:Uncharacterized protein n=1 Tax=Brachypodium distachyon TaxID=15368 RepID=A0A0Q3KJX1_BRADI|nr:hypothetical protein BRADI_2g60533v3 [Brachypodium distachyon]
MLSFVYADRKALENSFRLGFMLRLSESTDIIGTAVKCLRLVTPHFKSMADVVIKEITHLPTQDFAYVPSQIANAKMDHWKPRLWENICRTLNGWFRPDPLCCQGYEHRGNVPSCSARDSDGAGGSSDSGNNLRLSSIFPEPVYQVFLQRYISLSEYNNLVPMSSTETSTGYNDMSAPVENFPPLKLGILFLPHDSWEMDLKSASEADCAIEAIDGEKQQHLTHVNVHPDQLDEMLLPKATDYLYHNAKATTYQICWRSNHGSAHLCLEKTKMFKARKSTQRMNNNNVLCQIPHDQPISKDPCKQIIRDFLKLWVVHSSERLRTSISAWLGEEKTNG